MTQNNLIYSCKIVWSLNYPTILNKPKLKKIKNKITSTEYKLQNKKKHYFSTYNFIGISTGAKKTFLVKNTVAFERCKKFLFFLSELKFDFRLTTFGKTKKNLFVSENISLKKLSELNNDFVSLEVLTKDDFY